MRCGCFVNAFVSALWMPLWVFCEWLCDYFVNALCMFCKRCANAFGNTFVNTFVSALNMYWVFRWFIWALPIHFFEAALLQKLLISFYWTSFKIHPSLHPVVSTCLPPTAPTAPRSFPTCFHSASSRQKQKIFRFALTDHNAQKLPGGSERLPEDFPSVRQWFPRSSQQGPTNQKHTHAHCSHISSYGPKQSAALGHKNLAPLADQNRDRFFGYTERPTVTAE